MEQSLFTQNSSVGSPLSVRMRPRSLDEYVGQEHILGAGKLLNRAIQTDRISSLILYGPPGIGKTTLAFCICASKSIDAAVWYSFLIIALLSSLTQFQSLTGGAWRRKNDGFSNRHQLFK